MHLKFELKDPKKLEATLTITATVGDFTDMAHQLDVTSESVKWPLCQLRSAISDVMNAATKHFYQSASKDD